jgi:hypothetical protein
MKKNMVRITVGSIIGSAVVLAAVFFWQLHTKGDLDAALEKAKKDSKQAQKDMRRLVELRKYPSGLEDRIAANVQKIPPYELVPAGLMRQLLEIGTDLGLKDMRFDHELNAGFTEDQIKRKTDFMAAYAGAKIELEYCVMHFRASFQNLCVFLRRLYALDRVVALERLTVERRDNILPDQSVSMVLITYMTNTTQFSR